MPRVAWTKGIYPKDKVREGENSKTRGNEIKLSAHKSKLLREDDKANVYKELVASLELKL